MIKPFKFVNASSDPAEIGTLAVIPNAIINRTFGENLCNILGQLFALKHLSLTGLRGKPLTNMN